MCGRGRGWGCALLPEPKSFCGAGRRGSSHTQSETPRGTRPLHMAGCETNRPPRSVSVTEELTSPLASGTRLLPGHASCRVRRCICHSGRLPPFPVPHPRARADPGQTSPGSWVSGCPWHGAEGRPRGLRRMRKAGREPAGDRARPCHSELLVGVTRTLPEPAAARV